MKKNIPLKWHGGKSYLANKIIALMPLHTHYVEPYAGGLSVMLHKNPEGISEVANDISTDLTNFWQVLQHEILFKIFQRTIEATPFGEHFWKYSQWQLTDPDTYFEEDEKNRSVNRAIAFFILCRQSLAGRLESFAPLSKNRVRRGMNEQASAWLTAIEGLPEVHERLKRIVILNRDALDVINSEDSHNTLFYLDPPYLSTTRTSKNVYEHEYTTDQHEQLIEKICGCKGKVLLSGYDSPLYDRHLKKWKKHIFEIPNNASGKKEKEIMQEIVWMNF